MKEKILRKAGLVIRVYQDVLGFVWDEIECPPPSQEYNPLNSSGVFDTFEDAEQDALRILEHLEKFGWA